MKHFYITTAIDYANGSPHMGHAYEKILADVVARYQRLKGKPVHFVTGLDEHGQKIKQTADSRELEPQALCDLAAVEFQALCSALSITHDDFIRTTEPRHKHIVTQVLQSLYEAGDIYKSSYNGFYSPRTEQFLQEKDKINGQWPELYGDIIEISEPNYFFKLSQHQQWLIDYIKQHPDFIFPAFRAKQVLEFLKDPINDLCISRPKARLSWGIPLPFDAEFVTYVWFDALLNYVSAAQYTSQAFSDYWPADIHVIGKDILVPAHAVYWPIMLKAMGVALPRQLLVHGWWLKADKKMSKSEGNVINPMDIIARFGADSFRYFVIREMNVGQDSNFSEELFLSRYNNDLGNDLGNLLSRFLNMTHRYANGQVPVATVNSPREAALQQSWSTCLQSVLRLFDTFQFHTALEKLFGFIKAINSYTEACAPWKLAKSEDPEDQAALNTALATIAEGLRVAAVGLAPILPTVSAQILQRLGKGPVIDFEAQLQWSRTLEGNAVGEHLILFPRIEIA